MSRPNVFITNRRNGADYINDTNAIEGTWLEIYATETATAALVAANVGGTLTGVVITAGTSIEGDFTSITLASGAVWAYRR